MKVFRNFSNKLWSDKYSKVYSYIDSYEYFSQYNKEFLLSTLPIYAGGIALIAIPYTGQYLNLMPDITLYTTVYISMHCTFMTSLHLGFASVLHTETLSVTDPEENYQMVLPFAVPFVTCPLMYLCWAEPFTLTKFLISLNGFSLVYITTLASDYYFSYDKKTLPVWYFKLKKLSVVASVIGIAVFSYGVLAGGQEAEIRARVYPPTQEELAEIASRP